MHVKVLFVFARTNYSWVVSSCFFSVCACVVISLFSCSCMPLFMAVSKAVNHEANYGQLNKSEIY